MYYSDQNGILVIFFYLSWIFIGNYILLNLFLAIMLESFLREDDEEEEESLKEKEKIKELKNKNNNLKEADHD